MSAASTFLYTCTVTRFSMCLLIQISHVPPPARSLMPQSDQHLALYITFSQPQRQQAQQPLSVTQRYEHHDIQSPTHLILLSIQPWKFTCISFSSFAKLIRLVTFLEFTDATIHVSTILHFTACFRFISFAFQKFPLFIPAFLHTIKNKNTVAV